MRDLGNIGPNLGTSGVVVRLGIRFIRILIEKRPLRMFRGQFDRALHCSVRTFGARRQNDFSAKNLKQLSTFDRNVLGKNDLDRIALDAGDHRQRNAGVSRRRFDDGLARRKGSVGFGVFNHR